MMIRQLLTIVTAFLTMSFSQAGTVTVDIVKHLDQEIQIRALNSGDVMCMAPSSKTFSRGPYSPERKSVTCKSAMCQLRLLFMQQLPQGEQDWAMYNKVWFAWPLDPANFKARCNPAWLFPSDLFTIDFRLDVYDGPVIYPGSACQSLGLGCPTGYLGDTNGAADWNVTAVSILPPDEDSADGDDNQDVEDQENAGDGTNRYLKGSHRQDLEDSVPYSTNHGTTEYTLIRSSLNADIGTAPRYVGIQMGLQI